jgi:hypothetical protein
MNANARADRRAHVAVWLIIAGIIIFVFARPAATEVPADTTATATQSKFCVTYHGHRACEGDPMPPCTDPTICKFLMELPRIAREMP